MKPRLSLFVIVLAALLLAAPALAQDRPVIIATTTILADVAQNVAGDRLTVESLLPPDADTHSYEPTTDDARRLAEADALLIVGAGYEAFVEDLLANAGADLPVFVASTGIEILALGGHGHDHEHAEGESHSDDHAEATPEADHAEGETHAEATPEATPEADHAEGESHSDDHAHDHAEHLGVLGTDLECDAHTHEAESDHADGEGDHAAEGDHGDEHHHHGDCDPHVWTDPLNGIIWADNIAAAFAELDPANAEIYAANAAAYAEQLTALDAEIAALMETIPAERRAIVTNHEFMGYFAHRYGLEVVATVLPGMSDAELDPQGAADLIALLQDEQVPAIFAEVSANPELAQIIAQEAGVTVVTELYSEALSAADGPAATYLDYLRYNAQTIAAALTAN